jgi:hypothetical protein
MTEYPVDKKAAVMAALLEGQSVNSVAREYNIPKSTISRWKNSDVPFDGTQKNEIGGLILDFLSETLTTLKVQAVQFRDPSWMKKQPASEMGVLHGIESDKAFRMIEMLSKVNDATNNNPPQD